jgi:hypothetical protein
VLLPPATYLVSGIAVPAGITLQGYGATLKRLGNQPNSTRTLTTTGRLWDDDKDSPLLTIRGLTFDGSRDLQNWNGGFSMEQSHLLFLMANTAKAGRLRASVLDCRFTEGVADGISVYTNVDVEVSKVSAHNMFRGGLVVTGGHSKVTVNGLTTTGSLAWDSERARGIDVEVDGAGYGGSLKTGMRFTNIHLHAYSDFSVTGGSELHASNVTSDAPAFHVQSGPGSRAKFENCTFTVGETSSTLNRVVYAHDLEFSNCTFRVTAQGARPRPDRLFVGLRVWWNLGGGRQYEGQHLRLRNCKFVTIGTFAPSDAVVGISTVEDVAPYKNQLVVEGGSISPGFTRGMGMEAGGNWSIKGIKIAAAEGLRLDGYTTDNRYMNVVLDSIDYTGRGAYMFIVRGDPANTIVHKNVVLGRQKNRLGYQLSFVENRYLGARIIVGEADPTRVSTPGLKGDVYRMNVRCAGGFYEWVATNTDVAAATWKPTRCIAKAR